MLLVRALLNHGHEHPYLIERRDELLRSLNARLGALLVKAGANDPGTDLDPLLPSDYVTDILAVGSAERAEFDEWQDEMRRESRRNR